MFKRKTTFVIGAGASCELGLPSGDGLKDKIIALLNRSNENAYGFGNQTMQQIMRTLVGSNAGQIQPIVQPLREAADRIIKGLPLALSIDNYLHSHQDDGLVVRMGKLAIGICILESERGCHLFSRPRQSFYASSSDTVIKQSVSNDALDKTWYPAFARLLMAGVQRHNINSAFSNLRFVIFNYDRCFEQYIWLALQAYFNISEDESASILNEVEFIHPYGSLGMLPWRAKSDKSLDLGARNVTDYWEIGERLRTFTESVRSQTGQKVSTSIDIADTIILLGFGYLDQNLQLLRSGIKKRATRVLSTAYAVSHPDQQIMRDAMMSLGTQTAGMCHIEAGTCRDLFDNYRLMLSFA